MTVVSTGEPFVAQTEGAEVQADVSRADVSRAGVMPAWSRVWAAVAGNDGIGRCRRGDHHGRGDRGNGSKAQNKGTAECLHAEPLL
ncbi:hypothetical protein QMK19_18025 [Streptomyces sp. H10-C2]|uniref:hypothetical protein n=1 Tax=Streptomyces sp. PH10-H1 TaxID=3046212 RepID=UPI0024BBB6C6|nr:hypothetical protein [Streptomyces sp. PH10-H1]MDJ0343450.1 hypothetical protein [Streptomyces sp. PH10-H1]MDJ0371530.1 hypothetical protein [Streptomyces sp. H10-C2]